MKRGSACLTNIKMRPPARTGRRERLKRPAAYAHRLGAKKQRVSKDTWKTSWDIYTNVTFLILFDAQNSA